MKPAGLSHKLTLDLLAWAQEARVGAARDLGASVELYIDYGRICGSGVKAVTWQSQAIVLIPARYRPENYANDAFCAARIEYFNRLRGGKASRSPCACIEGGVAKFGLRTRRTGDRFKQKGMGGPISEKLKDWMIDRKIPRYLRDRVPLVTVDGDIIAICLKQTWHMSEPDPSISREDSSRVLTLL